MNPPREKSTTFSLQSSDWKDLEQIFSKNQISQDPETLAVYGKDWTNYYTIQASAVVFVESEPQLQELVQWARKRRMPLIPSGGRTGLSGGAVAHRGEIVVSFDRMNRLLDFNEADLCVKVQAGVVTDQVKEFAAEKGYFFPVAFASSGSSQIGGNIATNAGGINVLKYGLTRSWVSGLRVVTGRGELLSLNKGLQKNATGYDLRQLFIGSEGTLGFVTEADLQLTRQPQRTKTLLLGLESWDQVMKAFVEWRKLCDLLSYEVFDRACLEKVMSRGATDPLSQSYPFYVISECAISEFEGEDHLSQELEKLFDQGLVLDGVISQSSQQASELWALRENISESLAPQKPYKNDISVRTSAVPQFVRELETQVQSLYPGFEVLWFGHIGDGNLHLNILKPASMTMEEFVKNCRRVDQLLFEVVRKFQGSISAEHGVGLTKKDFLSFTRSAEEIEYLRAIKKIFDPDEIMNPGKMIDLS